MARTPEDELRALGDFMSEALRSPTPELQPPADALPPPPPRRDSSPLKQERGLFGVYAYGETGDESRTYTCAVRTFSAYTRKRLSKRASRALTDDG